MAAIWDICLRDTVESERNPAVFVTSRQVCLETWRRGTA